MGTQKVHCRGRGAARPALRQSFSSRVDEEHRPLHAEAEPASAETKEKPLAERIGKGLSLVRGTGLEPVTSCTSSMRSTTQVYSRHRLQMLSHTAQSYIYQRSLAPAMVQSHYTKIRDNVKGTQKSFLLLPQKRKKRRFAKKGRTSPCDFRRHGLYPCYVTCLFFFLWG